MCTNLKGPPYGRGLNNQTWICLSISKGVTHLVSSQRILTNCTHRPRVGMSFFFLFFLWQLELSLSGSDQKLLLWVVWYYLIEPRGTWSPGLDLADKPKAKVPGPQTPRNRNSLHFSLDPTFWACSAQSLSAISYKVKGPRQPTQIPPPQWLCRATGEGFACCEKDSLKSILRTWHVWLATSCDHSLMS